MLTQIQIPEPQAALLVACSRPHALAPSSVASPLMSSSPAWAGVVRLGAVSELRRRPVSERPRTFGFAAATRAVGYAAAPRVIGAGALGNGTAGTTSSKQDQQHLTDRRGPVTWRPPH